MGKALKKDAVFRTEDHHRLAIERVRHLNSSTVGNPAGKLRLLLVEELPHACTKRRFCSAFLMCVPSLS